MLEKERLKDGLRKMVSIMAEKRSYLLFVIILDILFILLLSKLVFIQAILNDVFFNLFISKLKLNWIYLALYAASGFFLMIIAYSFFKYLILNLIAQAFRETKICLKDFFSFLRLNLTVFTPVGILSAIILYSSAEYFDSILSRGNISQFGFILSFLAIGVFSVILSIYLYIFVNVLHFNFLREKNLKKLIKGSLANPFSPQHYRMFLNDFKVICIVIVVLLIARFFAMSLLSGNFKSYIKYYGYYKLFMISITTLAGYFIVLFNRFSFYFGIFNSGKNQ